MSEQLEHRWVKEIFTPDELKEYSKFESEWKAKTTSEEKASFEASWSSLVAEIQANVEQDPTSTVGIKLGEKCMSLVNGVYGKKYAKLRTKKFEEGFVKGKGLDEIGLTPESVTWLDKAICAYWQRREQAILQKVKQNSANQLLMESWQTLMNDMFGDDVDGRQSHLHSLISQHQSDVIIQTWLKSQ